MRLARSSRDVERQGSTAVKSRPPKVLARRVREVFTFGLELVVHRVIGGPPTG